MLSETVGRGIIECTHLQCDDGQKEGHICLHHNFIPGTLEKVNVGKYEEQLIFCVFEYLMYGDLVFTLLNMCFLLRVVRSVLFWRCFNAVIFFWSLFFLWCFVVLEWWCFVSVCVDIVFSSKDLDCSWWWWEFAEAGRRKELGWNIWTLTIYI